MIAIRNKANLRIKLFLVVIIAFVAIMATTFCQRSGSPESISSEKTEDNERVEKLVVRREYVAATSAASVNVTQQSQPPAYSANVTNKSDPVVFQEQDGFDDLLNRLRSRTDPWERQHILDAAFVWLKSLPIETSREMILAFLNDGNDFLTGMPFRLGPGGRLVSHTTLRVAALDWLGEIDAQNAAAYTKTLVDCSNSPDEWAIGLRNYGRQVEPASDSYFSVLIARMIENTGWRSNPTDGYLVAYDAFVFNKKYDLVPNLIELSGGSDPIKFVGAMAVESLMHEDNAGMIAFVHSNPSLFDAVPNLLANLYALADLEDPDHVAFLEHYLASEIISQDEKLQYLSSFPIQSKMLGHRLLTKPFAAPLAQRAMLDYQALLLSGKWHSMSGLESLHDALRVSARDIWIAFNQREGVMSCANEDNSAKIS